MEVGRRKLRPPGGAIMSTRNRPSNVQRSLPPTRRPAPSSVRSVPPAGAKARSTGGTGNLPIEGHRSLASLVLVLMMLLTLLAPLSGPGAEAEAFLTPRIDGSGSVLRAQGSHDLQRSIFSYTTFVERSQGSTSTTWPEVSSALRFDPSDTRARMAIVGHLYASTSGALNVKLKDTGMESRPSPLKIDEFEQAYRGFLEEDERGGRGANGRSAMALVRSLSAVGEERRRLELLALDGFREAINANVEIWQYTHNWALANLLAGNYTQAYEAMRVVGNRAETESDVLPDYWSGLA